MVPLPWLKASVMVLEHVHLGPIPNVLQHWGAMVEGSNDPQHHTPPPGYGPCGSKHLVSLGWLKLCGTIAMAQGQCNGVGTSI